MILLIGVCMLYVVCVLVCMARQFACMYMYACCCCGSRVVRKGLWCYGISVLLSFGGKNKSSCS